MNEIRLGTRSSPLALWQANETARLLRAAGHAVRLVPIRTTGDLRHDVALASIGGKGLFVKELEEALDRGAIDLAVHSLKDVPSILADRFTLAAFLERGDPRDVWVQPDGERIESLPSGAVVATSAPRRRAQLLARFPTLRIEPIRGNVGTRIAKLERRQYDGLVMARAGLERLGFTYAMAATFSLDEMIPAAGQAIVALEGLRTNRFACEAAELIGHGRSALAARSERGVLQHFGTRLDCTSCIAVHASFEDEAIVLRAFVSDPDSSNVIRVTERGTDAEALVSSVAEELCARGAAALLEGRTA